MILSGLAVTLGDLDLVDPGVGLSRGIHTVIRGRYWISDLAVFHWEPE